MRCMKGAVGIRTFEPDRRRAVKKLGRNSKIPLLGEAIAYASNVVVHAKCFLNDDDTATKRGVRPRNVRVHLAFVGKRKRHVLMHLASIAKQFFTKEKPRLFQKRRGVGYRTMRLTYRC